ncbi:hypothetical protein AGMMS49975_16890 [Clostridia bacterium]|nr:hypothetical protein AGMMS49975_16890 [Clostridia bacterium]
MNEKGMTLVEVLVAVVILSIVAAGFTLFFARTAWQSQILAASSRNTAEARGFADRVLNEVTEAASLSAIESALSSIPYAETNGATTNSFGYVNGTVQVQLEPSRNSSATVNVPTVRADMTSATESKNSIDSAGKVEATSETEIHLYKAYALPADAIIPSNVTSYVIDVKIQNTPIPAP